MKQHLHDMIFNQFKNTGKDIMSYVIFDNRKYEEIKRKPVYISIWTYLDPVLMVSSFGSNIVLSDMRHGWIFPVMVCIKIEDLFEISINDYQRDFFKSNILVNAKFLHYVKDITIEEVLNMHNDLQLIRECEG